MIAMIRTQIGNPKFPSASLDAVIDVSGAFTVAASFGNAETCTLWTQAGDFVVRASLQRTMAAIKQARESCEIVELLPQEKPAEPKTTSELAPQQSKTEE